MIRENGRKELAIAREKNRTVTYKGRVEYWVPTKGDGGWSMRSYGHSFNAKSGVVSESPRSAAAAIPDVARSHVGCEGGGAWAVWGGEY